MFLTWGFLPLIKFGTSSKGWRRGKGSSGLSLGLVPSACPAALAGLAFGWKECTGECRGSADRPAGAGGERAGSPLSSLGSTCPVFHVCTLGACFCGPGRCLLSLRFLVGEEQVPECPNNCLTSVAFGLLFLGTSYHGTDGPCASLVWSARLASDVRWMCCPA